MALCAGGSVLFHSVTALTLPVTNYSQQESRVTSIRILELFQFSGVKLVAEKRGAYQEWG